MQIAKDQDQAEEDVQFDLWHHLSEERYKDAVDREGNAEIAKDQLRNPVPDADIGFAVVLLHHFFDILGGADVNVLRRDR